MSVQASPGRQDAASSHLLFHAGGSGPGSAGGLFPFLKPLPAIRNAPGLEEAGATVVEIDDNREYPGPEELLVLLYEFKVGIEDYLSQSSSSIKTLQALIDFNNANAKKMMPYFEQEIFYKSNDTKKPHYNEVFYLWAMRDSNPRLPPCKGGTLNQLS